MLEFETVEEFAVASEISDAIVKVRLRRLLNHKPGHSSVRLIASTWRPEAISFSIAALMRWVLANLRLDFC